MRGGNALKVADKEFTAGEWGEALKIYSAHSDSGGKTEARARLMAGYCHAKLRNPSQARKEWQRLRELFPDAPEAASSLEAEAKLAASANDAARLAELLLSRHPKSPEAKRLLAAREGNTSEYHFHRSAGAQLRPTRRWQTGGSRKIPPLGNFSSSRRG